MLAKGLASKGMRLKLHVSSSAAKHVQPQYLKCGPRKAVNDQASPICYVWIKDDIQERITNLHQIDMS